MPIQPMLNSLELRGVQQIRTLENRAVVEQRIPGLEGNVLQDMGRGPTEILINGSLSYEEDREGVLNLQSLRDTYQSSESVQFIADILMGTEVQNVLIDDIRILENENRDGYFEFHIRLFEFTPAPAPSEVQETIEEEAEERQEDDETEVVDQLGRLEVEVRIEGVEDYSQIEVWVEGETNEGENYERIIRDQTDGLYILEQVPPGEYRVSAVERTE